MRTAVAAVAVTSGLLIGTAILPPAPASAAGPTTLTVTAPTPYGHVPLGGADLTGTAADIDKITSVRVVVTSAETKAVVASGPAVLSAPRTSSTSWRYFWRPPAAGTYTVKVTAVDATAVRTTKSVPVDVAGGAGAAYLTLLSGRSLHGLADANCGLVAGSVALPQIIDTLHGMGLRASGAVVTDWASEDGSITCTRGALYPSWQQLADLRDNRGFTVIGEGYDHARMSTLSPADQYDQACGSLPLFTAHGHHRAWGLFAYPGGWVDTTMQSATTQRCYAYGRVYSVGRNHQSLLGSPYLQKTVNVLGGACSDATLACSRRTGTKYLPVDRLTAFLDVQGGEWTVLQFYKFVTGARTAPASQPSWDCTSPDWRAHWTSAGEIYCWSDFVGALPKIPAGVTVTDPATVAEAWSPPRSAPATTFSGAPGATTRESTASFSFAADDARSWFTCSLDGGAPQLCDTGASYAGLAPGPHTLRVQATSAFGLAGEPATYTWTVEPAETP